MLAEAKEPELLAARREALKAGENPARKVGQAAGGTVDRPGEERRLDQPPKRPATEIPPMRPAAPYPGSTPVARVSKARSRSQWWRSAPQAARSWVASTDPTTKAPPPDIGRETSRFANYRIRLVYGRDCALGGKAVNVTVRDAIAEASIDGKPSIARASSGSPRPSTSSLTARSAVRAPGRSGQPANHPGLSDGPRRRSEHRGPRRLDPDRGARARPGRLTHAGVTHVDAWVDTDRMSTASR